MDERVSFSAQHRHLFLKRAKGELFDLIVIGGGITGAGIALDARSRGLSVCLVEKGDFASGTSGKSTKLIHGGLRYLKQFEFGLVKEVGQERALLHQLAPHLVVPEKMVLPIIEGGSLGKVMTSIGLYIYDFLADVEGEDKRKMLDVHQIQEIEPLLPTDKLLGGSIYAEYRTDDSRLTIEVAKSAFRLGANLLSYVECQGIIEDEGAVVGITCEDLVASEKFEIRGRNICNAAGPWVDDIRTFCGTVQGKRLYLTKGVHVVVPRSKLPVNHSVYFDAPHDNRMIFAIPRLDTTYIGTTDTYYDGNKDQVVVLRSDVEYLLGAVNQTFSIEPLRINDVMSSWAGLRPLIYEDGKSASEISRRDEIFEAANGLLSIAGGKLTGYRKMAERIVDRVITRMYPQTAGDHPSKTEGIPLVEPAYTNYGEVENGIETLVKKHAKLNLPQNHFIYLVQNYGKAAKVILEKVSQEKQEGSTIFDLLLKAELDYCSEFEMIVRPEDFLVRRSGRTYFMPGTIDRAKDVTFEYFRTSQSRALIDLDVERERWFALAKTMTEFA